MSDDRRLPPSPRPLDRISLERVLSRAAELQATEITTEPGPKNELISEAQLFEIGQEVGLSPTHLRQALAEERTRVNLVEDAGLAGRISGPSYAVASRLLAGRAEDILTDINAWMQNEECLRVQRQYTDRMIWEARGDLLGNLRISFKLGGRDYMLARASSVGATVVQVEAEKVLVRLDADVSRGRTNRLRAGTAMAGAGALAGAGAIAIGLAANALFPLVLVASAIPTAIGGLTGYRIAKGHRSVVIRTQLALEQVLDRLEHGALRRRGFLRDAIAATRPLLR
jgi:hypothetical protein